MDEHDIAVIERNAYIKPRDGSLAANPALGGPAILLPTYLFVDVFSFEPSFRFFVIQTSLLRQKKKNY